MNRRQFLKRSALLASGLSATLTGGLPKSLFAHDQSADHFALQLITDQPDFALPVIDDFIKGAHLHKHKINFAEQPLLGNYVGDIVLIQNNKLVNYKNPSDPLSRKLAQVSKELALPRTVANPILIKFETAKATPIPKTIDVFRKNVLIHQFDIHANEAAFEVMGVKGGLTVSIADKRVQILSASCKHQTCVKMGAIHQPGQNLVCIPNQLRIAIAGENRFGVDGVTF